MPSEHKKTSFYLFGVYVSLGWEANIQMLQDFSATQTHVIFQYMIWRILASSYPSEAKENNNNSDENR